MLAWMCVTSRSIECDTSHCIECDTCVCGCVGVGGSVGIGVGDVGVDVSHIALYGV